MRKPDSKVAAGRWAAAILPDGIHVGPLASVGDGLGLDGRVVFHVGRRVVVDQGVGDFVLAPEKVGVVGDPALVDGGCVVVWRRYVRRTDVNQLLAVTAKRASVDSRGYLKVWFGLLVGSVRFEPGGDDLFLFAWRS